MPHLTDIETLESSISRFYERYSARRVAMAAFLVGLFSIGASLVTYILTAHAISAVAAFALVGLVTVNLTMIFIVPPAKRLAAARELITNAIKEPSRIKSFDVRGIKLADKHGEVHGLSGVDSQVWQNIVVPYLVQVQAAGAQGKGSVKKERKLTASERRHIENRRREVLEIEKKIETQRKQLEEQQKALEAKSAELSEAEKRANQVISKAESINSEALEKAKREQETKFAAREKEIAELQKRLEEERRDLEERTAYVTNVEESLVDRLNELTTREASIEQGEINAGIRSDS